MRVSRFLRPVLLGLAAASLVMQPVAATGGSYGWSSCNWEDSNYNPDGDVRVRASGYPGDGWGDGVKNSFSDRITSAVNDWNSALDRAGYVVPSTLFRIADGGSGEDIYVEQYNLLPAYWGTALTYSTLGSDSCTMHSLSNEPILWVRVRTAFYNDWFTQDDTRRSLWEACPANSYQPAYTCSKKQDFESILMHELGHALGLPHPQDVDTHQSSLSPNAADLASCGTPNDRATLCSNVGQQYMTSARTLHAWDRESLRVLETKH